MLRRWANRLGEGDRGSMLPYVVFGIFLVVLIGYMLIRYLGDAYDESREAKTASDAAALAAAEAWAEALEEEYTDALTSTNEVEFWSHFGRPLTQTKDKADTDAAEYAGNNDATITSITYDTRTATVKVSVRGNDQIQDSGRRAEATASAQVVFEKGICNSEGMLGVSVGGACATSPASATLPDDFDYTASLEGILPETRTRLVRR